jgi:hypothetical protein
MRSYHIDDLQPEDVARLGRALDARGMKSAMEAMYWLDLPAALLSAEQREHAADCGPHSVGVELGEDWVHAELLVRARNRLRCSCVCYADAAQRAWVMDELDRTLRELDIPV